MTLPDEWFSNEKRELVLESDTTAIILMSGGFFGRARTDVQPLFYWDYSVRF